MKKNKEQPPLPTLPMHLMMSMGCWLSSPFAWQCANAGFPNLNHVPDLPRLSQAELGKLQSAIAQEAKKRANSLLSGVLRYYDTPYTRQVKEPPVIWQRGNARLLDYGQGMDASSMRHMVLFVPSLINRYYILDLEKDRSFLRYLSSEGVYPLVLDWGAPGEYEEKFGCDTYITHILHEAIRFLCATSGNKIALAGYCMGGVLTLAAAQLWKNHVSGLALLATPWNFHCDAFKPFILDKQCHSILNKMITSQKTLPAHIVQSLFYWTDPWVFEHKFRRFSELAPGSRAEHDFITLERWVNDGVPMTAGVAQDCLIGWAQNNTLHLGQWSVANKKIQPKNINIPTLIAIPESDHVVPYDCALPLVQAMKNAEIIRPSSGHVGMIIGSRAKKELWKPLTDWLKSIS